MLKRTDLSVLFFIQFSILKKSKHVTTCIHPACEQVRTGFSTQLIAQLIIKIIATMPRKLYNILLIIAIMIYH